MPPRTGAPHAAAPPGYGHLRTIDRARGGINRAVQANVQHVVFIGDGRRAARAGAAGGAPWPACAPDRVKLTHPAAGGPGPPPAAARCLRAF